MEEMEAMTITPIDLSSLIAHVNQTWQWFEERLLWFLTIQVDMASVLFVALFALAIFMLRSKRDTTMDPNRNNKQLVQYALGDALLELLLADRISTNDHNYWAHRLADEFDMPAMRSRKRIKGRLAKYLKAQAEERREALKKQRPNIPGPKPGEGVKTESTAASQLKAFFARVA